MTIDYQRGVVVSEAESWVGTPFRSNAKVKGPYGGVCCANFISETFNRALGLNIVVELYGDQWVKNQTKELYIERLIAAGFVEVSRELMKPGDICLSKVHEPLYCHGSIITSWPWLIHACSRGNAAKSGVVKSNANASWYFSFYDLKFFSRREWHANLQ